MYLYDSWKKRAVNYLYVCSGYWQSDDSPEFAREGEKSLKILREADDSPEILQEAETTFEIFRKIAKPPSISHIENRWTSSTAWQVLSNSSSYVLSTSLWHTFIDICKYWPVISPSLRVSCIPRTGHGPTVPSAYLDDVTSSSGLIYRSDANSALTCRPRRESPITEHSFGHRGHQWLQRARV